MQISSWSSFALKENSPVEQDEDNNEYFHCTPISPSLVSPLRYYN